MASDRDADSCTSDSDRDAQASNAALEATIGECRILLRATDRRLAAQDRSGAPAIGSDAAKRS